MKARSLVLYASVALNAALLVLVACPRAADNTALAQVGQTGGMAVLGAGGSGGGTWLADRVTGTLLLYQYQLQVSGNADRVILLDSRNLRVDLDERQLGNIILVSASANDTPAAAYVIDTDSQRLVAYEYDRSNKVIRRIQRIDLRAAFQASAGPAPE